MKKYILLLASFVLAGTMMARQLTPDQALALALGKMNVAQPQNTRAQSANAARARLMHTEMNAQDAPLYYVYDRAEGGFIIASADDRASVLLGYTDSGDFAGAQQNLSFMAWLKDCRKALNYIGSMPEEYSITSAVTRALGTSVSPLLGEISWDQNAPYNLLTPLRVGYPYVGAEPDTIHAPTGCAATSVAQVMMYHQWPATGMGIHTNMKDSLQTVDFSQSTYQWSKMLPAYEGGESEESRLAVAKLMSDVGCALNMDYDYEESGTVIKESLKALATYFGYDKNMTLIYRTECSSEEWNDLLMTELNESRPVLFRANATSGGGHQFVIDGYDTNALYHVNWGWSGEANGYFNINLMDPDFKGIGGYDGGYTISQGMILGIKPDENGTSVAKPDLVLTTHFNFEEDVKQWSYKVSNNGLGDFMGELGIAMESPTGEVTRLITYKFDAEPMKFDKTIKNLFETPVAPGIGYKLYPYYCDEVGGEIKNIPAPYSSFNTLISKEEDGEYVWERDLTGVSDFDLVNVELKHNYVGFDPQFNLTVSNSAESLKEYAEDLYIDITTMVNGVEKKVCMGSAQAFINPGETKELVIKCNQVEDAFKGKIYEGEYKYTIYFGTGGLYYYQRGESFMMVNVPPSEITYSDFTVNKTELQPGEELIACMTVTNTGGFDVKDLKFALMRKSDQKVFSVELRKVDIEPDSNETYTFKKVLPSTPGEYVGGFFVNGKQLDDVATVSITVVDPTAIDKVESAPDSDGMSGIFDLQGRPVQQMHKGEVYISKGKFVVK